jgi:hypothetical protein
VSTLNVDKVDPSTGTDLEIGSSGDTITIPSGATIVNSGTATGFGAALTGSTNNQVVTVTGANAIAGETNFIYDGTIVGAGADGANADLGVGLHIKISDTSASVNSGADALVLEDNGGDMGMSILSSTSGQGRIEFGDSGNNAIGGIKYDHGDNSMRLYANDAERMRIDSTGRIILADTNTSDHSLVGTLNINELSGHSAVVSTFRDNTATICHYAFDNPNGNVGQIQTSGSATNYVTSSDYRLKENETSITDGIDRVKQLKPYKFNFKADADKTVDGFFAHEVSGIVPEAISGEKDAVEKNEDGTDKLDKDGNTIPVWQGIDQAKLVPLLTSALQEAITKIETLEAKVTALENA